MPQPRQTHLFRWLAGVWVVFLVVLSFLPAHVKNRLHTKGPLHDAGHLLMFGALAWLLARAARSRAQAIALLFLTAGLGFAIELGQDLKIMLPAGSWAPVEWHDVLIDVMAVTLGGIVYFATRPAQVPPTRMPAVRIQSKRVSPRNDRGTAA